MVVNTYPIWQLRFVSQAPRYLLCAASLAGIVASARFAILPPRASQRALSKPAGAQPDLAAEGYALLFARSYLSWNVAETQEDARALEAFAGPGMEPDAGRQLPASGEQHVEWAQVVQEREARPGEHVYTVAAQTDTAGLLYLTVAVGRTSQGRPALAGYPAFVGPPALGPAQLDEGVREISDPGLRTVVERALRNYLANAPAELAADLTGGARVSLPAPGMVLASIQRVAWTADGRSVVAVVQVQDSRGTQYTLAYELDVAQAQGRWEVAAVQMNPYS